MEEQVRTQFDVNVFGVMHTIRTILPHFKENKAGMIINISSGSFYLAIDFAVCSF
jgi:NADP-dependent 3-hydroxy acid dehydrogenase YdfG